MFHRGETIGISDDGGRTWEAHRIITGVCDWTKSRSLHFSWRDGKPEFRGGRPHGAPICVLRRLRDGMLVNLFAGGELAEVGPSEAVL